jgi:pimeloyl-ACP methyl ester carboxylesterase
MGIEAQPFYFRSGDSELFAWLHPAAAQAGVTASLGLVICQPFGYEALCAHLSLRAWAQTAAAAGVPVLRFDYPGTGDSADGDAEAEQLRLWSRGIADAAAQLRRRCGVQRVCLLGLRLGALAAALAAAEHGGIDALIAIAPVTSGRRYLRELRALQGSLALAQRGGSSGHGTVAQEHEAGLEVTGFRLSPATQTRLSGLEIATAAVPPRDVLIIDRDDLPEAVRWAQELPRASARVRYLALPGYGEMISRPHTTVVPRGMIDATTAWLRDLSGNGSAAAADGASRTDASRADEGCAPDAQAAIRLQLPGGQVLERAVFIDAERTLFGLLDEPAADRDRPGGCSGSVILLNAGATYHAGPNRMYVGLARRWAARGYRVLRLDLAGLGDSDVRAGRPQNEVYAPGALADVRAAVEFMRARAAGDRNGGELTLVGLCSGAYHSLRAAVAGLPVQRLLMINPLTYFWKEGMTLSDLQDAEVLRGPAIYRERMRSGKSWRKLLTGRVDLRPIARTLAQRAWLALDSERRDFARRLRVHLADDLGWELEQLCARGVRVVFLFARGDPGVALLNLQAGSSIRRLAGRCRIHFLDGADHIFSQSGPRARLEQLLEQELMAVNATASQPGTPQTPPMQAGREFSQPPALAAAERSTGIR